MYSALNGNGKLETSQLVKHGSTSGTEAEVVVHSTHCTARLLQMLDSFPRHMARIKKTWQEVRCSVGPFVSVNNTINPRCRRVSAPIIFWIMKGFKVRE